MSEQRNREEVVNFQFKLVISKFGVTADAETIHVHEKHHPEVLFQLHGLRVVFKGKPKIMPNSEQVLLANTRRRVRSSSVNIVVTTV